MNLRELFKLKEQLLANLNKDIRESDYPDHEAYKHHYYGAMEGIMAFYVHAMIQIIDSEIESDSKSKSA